jgi:hypothetical protein
VAAFEAHTCRVDAFVETVPISTAPPAASSQRIVVATLVAVESVIGIVRNFLRIFGSDIETHLPVRCGARSPHEALQSGSNALYEVRSSA